MADEEERSSSDDSLDVRSDKFEPEKAIYSLKIKLPVENAPVFDNVGKFESKLKNIEGAIEKGECSTRKFLPHQGRLCFLLVSLPLVISCGPKPDSIIFFLIKNFVFDDKKICLGPRGFY